MYLNKLFRKQLKICYQKQVSISKTFPQCFKSQPPKMTKMYLFIVEQGKLDL